MIRRTYIRKVEGRLERFEDGIDHLRKRMATPVGDIRDQIERETRELRSKAEVVRERRPAALLEKHGRGPNGPQTPRKQVTLKGFVRFRDGDSPFNHVAGRAELEEFPAERTELAFIGSKVEQDREAIGGLLRSCDVP
jgi:hypothetical protein